MCLPPPVPYLLQKCGGSCPPVPYVSGAYAAASSADVVRSGASRRQWEVTLACLGVELESTGAGLADRITVSTLIEVCAVVGVGIEPEGVVSGVRFRAHKRS